MKCIFKLTVVLVMAVIFGSCSNLQEAPQSESDAKKVVKQQVQSIVMKASRGVTNSL